MDNARVEEYRDDEPVPLIRLRIVRDAASDVGIRYALEAAQVRERAFVHGTGGKIRGCVWTGPGYGFGGVLDAVDGFHARDVAGAHVDEDVDGGAQHRVYLRVDGDGGAGEYGCGRLSVRALKSGG